jgi:hypothetical protein
MKAREVKIEGSYTFAKNYCIFGENANDSKSTYSYLHKDTNGLILSSLNA